MSEKKEYLVAWMVLDVPDAPVFRAENVTREVPLLKGDLGLLREQICEQFHHRIVRVLGFSEWANG